MINGLTPEQEELRGTVRRFLADKSPEAEVRRLMATGDGYDPAVWRQIAGQLGLHGLAIPEEYGGQGFTWAELGLVLEETGRAVLGGPFFASVVLAATAVLQSGDDDAKRRLLPGIADGTLIATLALPDGPLHAVPAAAVGDGQAWRLSGTVPLVPDAHVADVILVPARASDGVTLFEVRRNAPGVAAALRPTLDQTRKLADVTLDGATATLIGVPGGAEPVLAATRDYAITGLAAEQVGVAQAALDMAVAYMKVRVQFGQPIGAFQALKHMAADVLVEVETARSAAYYALDAAVSGSADFPAAAALAAAYCGDAAVTATHQNIQFHGGMGFTWEIPAHLYFKRARASELLFGEPSAHRERLAELLGV
jgi:alkylation response protein AidB-like acyl-CoA dehydrogenase